MSIIQKKRNFFKIGEEAWLKAEKKEVIIEALDIANLNATISVKSENSTEMKLVKFWEIDKLHKAKNHQSKTLEIKVKYFGDVEKLVKTSKGDWIDLRSVEDVEMKQFDFKLIKLNVAMQLPHGYEAHVLPRSSTYKNFGIILANSQGVIDNSYSGDGDQWMFPAIALRDTTIKAGDRICQFRIMKSMPPVKITEATTLGNPDRGGIGSTGTN